ncbi:MAG: Lrp/AsnC family transcriptional regulator [Bacteroidota bacterium]
MINGRLDDTDFRILELLQQDGRMDAAQVASLVHKSPTPVRQRIRKLQEDGYIKTFAAILDREKIGRPVLVVTHVQLEKQTTPLLNEFEQWVLAMAEVQCCLHVSGEWNFILHITAATPQAYFQFLMEKINSLPNVAHTDSCFVMKECKSGGPLVL